jgi:hypothetical protein
MKIRHIIAATAIAGIALACGGEPEPPSEGKDAKALCKAFLSEEAGDADSTTDAAVAAATVETDWGKSMQTDLQAGDGPTEAVQKAFVAKIKETKASEGSLDCSLIEGFWGMELE